MLSFGRWKEENGKYEEIQRKTEVKSVPVYSDDADAFKGNAATADGIKNMVNLMDIDAYLPFHRNTDI